VPVKPLPPIAGRGAPANPRPVRTGSLDREADGDWLDAAEAIDGDAPPLRTTVTAEHPKTIIARNMSPDIGFDRSINPYRGCDQSRNGCDANQENLTPSKHTSFTGVSWTLSFTSGGQRSIRKTGIR